MKYPNKLKHWREARRYTMPALAKELVRAGFKTANKQLIYKIENGDRKISAKEAMALASILKCKTEDLFDNSLSGTQKSDETNLSTGQTPLDIACNIMKAYSEAPGEAKAIFDGAYAAVVTSKARPPERGITVPQSA